MRQSWSPMSGPVGLLQGLPGLIHPFIHFSNEPSLPTVPVPHPRPGPKDADKDWVRL